MPRHDMAAASVSAAGVGATARRRRCAAPGRWLSALLLALLLVSAAACGVNQEVHDALQQDYDRNQKELAKTRDRNRGIEVALREEQDRVRDLQSRIDNLNADNSEMRQALQELKRRKAEAEARIKEYRAFLDRFKTLIAQGKLKVKIRDGRMVVELATDVLFATGRADLSAQGLAAVQEVGGLLASIPKYKYQIEGHTDNVPIANARFPSNWELASARSLTVLKQMVATGMPAKRISAASFGDSIPAKENTTAQGRAANRRIEIVVVPDLRGLPGVDELNEMG